MQKSGFKFCGGIRFTTYCSGYFNQTLKKKTMGNLLYLIAVILIIGWLVGFFAYGGESLIHVLLVVALISIILGVLQGNRRVN